MDKFKDPDSKKIENVCKSLIGSKINILYEILLTDGSKYSESIDNCNVVGDFMESLLLPFLQKRVPTIEKGPKQSSPDFWNRNREYEWELKIFTGKPGFDISNFSSYINQLIADNGVKRKLYKTQYLIFKYTMKKTHIVIDDFKIYNVWNIIGYDGKYPISLQCKRNVWYNIRPCSFNKMSYTKTDKKFIKNLIEAIKKCPNTIENKEDIIDKLNYQFNIIQLELLTIN